MISVRERIGSYNLCDPRQKQQLVEIQYHNERFGLMMDEDYGFRATDKWHDSVPAVFADYCAKTLWSSDMKRCKELADYFKTDEGQDELYIAWKMDKIAKLSRALRETKDQLQKLGVVAE